MKVFRIPASIALTCLLALCLPSMASAQGRRYSRSHDANPNAGGRDGKIGTNTQGSGRTDNDRDSDSDDDRGTGKQRGAGKHGKKKCGEARGENGQRPHDGLENTDQTGSNHGQEVSARRHAAIEAWKASGKCGPPPWAGVGGGPGGNPNHPDQGQQNGKGRGKGKGRGMGKSKAAGQG